MTNYTYKQIISKAKECNTNLKKEYKNGISTAWSYYFAKVILNGKKDVKKISIKEAPAPSGDNLSRGIKSAEYKDICKRLVTYVEKNKQLPNYVTYKNFKIKPYLLTTFLAKIIVNNFPKEQSINSKWYTKPLETKNKVYNYFCKVFNKGKKVMKIDEALGLVDGRGYATYYDDKLSNKQTIDAMAKNNKDDPNDPNCTDSCHVFMNIGLQLVELKVYKKVECLHVDCSSGGHVKLRFTKNDGSTFIRDPACVISHNGKPITCGWCTNSPKAVNPNWFMANLNR